MQRSDLPSLSALRAFDAAARHESFTMAAAELGLTQAAISRHIRHLEAKLGFPLFERGHRSVSLTQSGADYAQHVIEGFARLAQTPGRARQPKVVLDIDAELLRFWLLPRLTPGLIDSFGARLEFRARADRPRLLPGDTDLAITWGLLDYKGYERRRFLQPTVIPVIGASSPVRSIEDLGDTLLLHDQSDHWWRAMLRAADLPYAEGGSSINFSRCDFPVEAAAQGLGAAISDDIIAASYLEAGKLKRLDGPTLKSQDYFLMVKERIRGEAAQAFVDWLNEQI